MKRFLASSLLLICFSCLTEESADPGEATTFVRYYNGGSDDHPEAFEEIGDGGFIILATSFQAGLNEAETPSRIKLIQTDKYGNAEEPVIYPAYTTEGNALAHDNYFKAMGLWVDSNGGAVTGYTVVGEKIVRSVQGSQVSFSSYLYIHQTDANGAYIRSQAFPETGRSGRAITRDQNGDYLILAYQMNSLNDMVLAKISKTDLSMVWSRQYGSGSSGNFIGLIADENNIFWSGTVTRDDRQDVRLVRTVPDSETSYDWPFGNPAFNEVAGGMCRNSSVSGFAIVGTTDEHNNNDIFYKQIAEDGTERVTAIIGDASIPEEGNAITSTDDGSLVIIGTTGTGDGKDYYLIKIGYLGQVIWSRVFGSEKGEKGIAIRQISDGSYVILGSTTLGGLNGIMLMKTDREGNIE